MVVFACFQAIQTNPVYVWCCVLSFLFLFFLCFFSFISVLYLSSGGYCSYGAQWPIWIAINAHYLNAWKKRKRKSNVFVYSAKKVRIKRVKILFKFRDTQLGTDITNKILKEGEPETKHWKYITPENKNCTQLTVTFKDIIIQQLRIEQTKERKINQTNSNQIQEWTGISCNKLFSSVSFLFHFFSSSFLRSSVYLPFHLSFRVCEETK